MNSERPSLTRAVSVALAVFACIGISGRSTSTPLYAADAKNASSVVNVTEADNGKDIDITNGQILQVRLKSNAGTGYAWTLSGDPAPVKLVKSFSQKSKDTSGMAGAPRISVFQLQATAAGLANVTFVYRRSWEYNVPPAKTFKHSGERAMRTTHFVVAAAGVSGSPPNPPVAGHSWVSC